jgi:D-glycerate 3-kinase
MKPEQILRDFIRDEKLPNDYIDVAAEHFLPVLDAIKSHHNSAKRPLIVGINGAQGSGKSTLSSLLTVFFNKITDLHCVSMSLDDFYLTKAEREELAQNTHPLLLTRGVPGTHDIPLLTDVIQSLQTANTAIIPRFDKAIDDRAPRAQWQHLTQPADVIILEGWCIGTPPQSVTALNEAINTLERSEDPDGKWRHFVNEQLSGPYAQVFASIDFLIMLRAPSFDAIYRWRCEQEHKMRERLLRTNHVLSDENNSCIGMSDEQILRFIQHYQRITEHGLHTLAPLCDIVFELDEYRRISA